MPHWSAHRGLGACGAECAAELATLPAGMGEAIAVAAGRIAAPAARVVAVAARTRRRFQLLMTFSRFSRGRIDPARDGNASRNSVNPFLGGSGCRKQI
jgi:hypothetical protein